MIGIVNIEKLYWFEIGLAGSHEVEAVGFGFGEGAFMCSDLFVAWVEFEQGEKTTHDHRCIIEVILDFVGVDGGCVYLSDDGCFLPLGEEVLCTSVAVVGISVGGFDFI